MWPVEVKVKIENTREFRGESRSNTVRRRQNGVKCEIDRDSARCLLSVFAFFGLVTTLILETVLESEPE